MKQENPFGPKQINIQEIGVDTLGSLIAGVIGSVIMLIIMFLFGEFLNLGSNLINPVIDLKTNSMFPFMLSLVAFVGTTITMFLTYFFLTLTGGDRYKKSNIIRGQIAFLVLICYICITPLYIYAGVQNYNNILYVFLGHTLFVAFGIHIIIQLLNNYRYVLIGLYGSFIGLFISIVFTTIIFFNFTSGYAKLISLLFLLPIINLSITFFKEIFEYIYYAYNRTTNIDTLGDIFYQLEVEEKEQVKESLEKDTI